MSLDIKTTLVQCAWAASRKKDSYLQARFQRLRHRRTEKGHVRSRRFDPDSHPPHVARRHVLS